MLTDKIALVTGAGSGIGLGIAWELAEQGILVILAGRSDGSILEAAEQIRERGGRSFPRISENWPRPPCKRGLLISQVPIFSSTAAICCRKRM